MSKITIILAAAVIALFAIGALVGSSESPSPALGGMTNYDGLTITPVDSSDGLKIGSSGSTLAKLIKGTCDLTGGTVAATSSAFGTCAATGVVSGDLVFVSLATSSASAAIVGAQASSTSGFITIKLINLSGASANITAFGTSTSYWVVR